MVATEHFKPGVHSGLSPDSKDGLVKDQGSSSSDEKREEAAKALMIGKEFLLKPDISTAVSFLAEACSLYVKVYGEMAPECGEAYFYYGKALLEMSRIENTVLGNALEGVPDSEEEVDVENVEDPEKLTEKESEDVQKMVGEALKENFVKHDSIAKLHLGENITGEGDEDSDGGDSHDESENVCVEEEKDSQESDIERESESKSAGENCGPCKKKVEGDHESQDVDDLSCLELAWEMLELAKLIYTKNAESSADPEIETRIWETYMLLGEVSLENQDYSQAVDDLNVCLQRQINVLPADSRLLSETYYQLGLALGFGMRWEEAKNSHKESIKILETRMKNLKAKYPGVEVEEEEVKELEGLIPEIKEKISDTDDMEAEVKRGLAEAAGLIKGSSSNDAISPKSILTKTKSDNEVETKNTNES